MYLAPQNIPRAISVLILGNKAILYYTVLYCIKRISRRTVCLAYLYLCDARALDTVLRHTNRIIGLRKLGIVVVDVNDVESHTDSVAEVVTGVSFPCHNLHIDMQTAASLLPDCPSTLTPGYVPQKSETRMTANVLKQDSNT